MNEKIPEDREWLTYKEAQILSGYGRTTLWRVANEDMWSQVPGSEPNFSDGRKLDATGDGS